MTTNVSARSCATEKALRFGPGTMAAQSAQLWMTATLSGSAPLPATSRSRMVSPRAITRSALRSRYRFTWASARSTVSLWKSSSRRRHLGEDVLAEEHEAGLGSPRREQARQADDRRIGEGNDDIRPAHPQPGETRREEVAHVVQRPAHESLRAQRRTPRPDDLDAVVPLPLEEPSPPGRPASGPGRAQGGTRHHGNLAPVHPDQILCQLGEELTGGRLVRIVGSVEEADPQR